jgi:hypothetical protein
MRSIVSNPGWKRKKNTGIGNLEGRRFAIVVDRNDALTRISHQGAGSRL